MSKEITLEQAAGLGGNFHRYFLGHDDSGHTYLVPVAYRDEWMKWEEFQSTNSDKWTDEEAAYAWNEPVYARRIDGTGRLTFTGPKEK